jgi:hypothetical protein
MEVNRKVAQALEGRNEAAAGGRFA